MKQCLSGNSACNYRLMSFASKTSLVPSCSKSTFPDRMYHLCHNLNTSCIQCQHMLAPKTLSPIVAGSIACITHTGKVKNSTEYKNED